jgi:hypothetical protein
LGEYPPETEVCFEMIHPASNFEFTATRKLTSADLEEDGWVCFSGVPI